MSGRARRTLAAILAATVAGVLVGGCGVPAHTDVQVEGPPAEFGGTGAGGEPDPPPGPEEAADEQELVDFFLRAAAADPENPMDALRPFIHPDVRADWDPDTRVYVARIGDDPVVTRGETVRFELEVRRVGVLTSNGMIEPRTFQGEPRSVVLRVASEPVPPADRPPAGGLRYWLVDVPPMILLDDRALELHFDPRPIYFWDTHEGALVPDLRWLPHAVPETQRPQAAVDWLIAGPAPWLAETVASVEGVERVGNVVPGQESLEVRLTVPPETVDLPKLDAQLWWSLRPDLDGGVDLIVVVNGEPRHLRDSYREANPVPDRPPASFAVLDGEIRQHVPAEAVPVPALAGGVENVRRAAISRDRRHAALVQPAPDGRDRLTLTQPGRQTPTDLVAGAIGQPVWLNNPPGSGLVVADGELWQFVSGEKKVERVDVDLPEPLTAVAVAPDGRRIALVAGGRLYLASMARAGGTVMLSSPPRPLATTASNLDGVAFLREEWLAVVGTAQGQSRLFELTVDGALERELPGGGLGNPDRIGSFVAHPGDPTDPADRGTIMFQADDLSWRYVHPQSPVRITAELLRGYETPDPEVEPSEPSAPFFVE
ncbi:MAG TPA: LpqB family beta-propeller domain-containing protein [Natronosporangium sp.]|nr:LpqB family beta-propeller domain-containing protein [Natronosporangium sp.]